jgi:hypothetical protein
MIGHHFSGTSLAIELAVVVALLVTFGTIAWRERRRRSRPRSGGARMRDEGGYRGETKPP